MPWVYTVTVRTFCTEREEETAGVEEGEGETGSAEHPKAAKRHAASRGKRRTAYPLRHLMPWGVSSSRMFLAFSSSRIRSAVAQSFSWRALVR